MITQSETTGIDLLRHHCPDFFTRPATILYVGASPHRFALQMSMIEACHKVVLLERYYPNARFFRENHSLEWVIYGDVRDIWDYQIPIDIDVAIWWHGPEHVEKSEIEEAVLNLELIARSLVILASPWGHCPQGDFGGNPYEVHRSTLYPRDYVKLEYDIATCGEVDKPPKSDIVAWKWIGGEW